MAEINNPQTVKHCNDKYRRMCDLIECARRTAQQYAIDVVTEFEANVGGNANGDVIVDGAATDGRGIVTKLDILGLKYVAEQMVICLTTDDRAEIVARGSVNGNPLF